LESLFILNRLLLLILRNIYFVEAILGLIYIAVVIS
jgi:hypothetical protein